MESELLEVNANNEKLDRSKHELAELHTVLEKVRKFMAICCLLSRESATPIVSAFNILCCLQFE